MATNNGSLSQSAFQRQTRLRGFSPSLVSSNRHALVYRLDPSSTSKSPAASYCLKMLSSDETVLTQHEAVLRKIPRMKTGYRPQDLPLSPLVSFGRLACPSDENRRALWIATPWVEGVALSRLMDGAARRRSPFLFSDALRIARSIAKNIVDLGRLEGSSTRLVHGDLKPANIVVTSQAPAHCVLVDLDTACFEGDGRAPLCGTVGYAAPECFSARHPEARVDAAQDVYSFGVILHELLTGRRPRLLSPKSAQPRRHRADPAGDVWEPIVDASLSADVRDLVASCLALCPADRPRPDALLRAISCLVERYEESGLHCGRVPREHDLPTLLHG